jgi:hypothetical protein
LRAKSLLGIVEDAIGSAQRIALRNTSIEKDKQRGSNRSARGEQREERGERTFILVLVREEECMHACIVCLDFFVCPSVCIYVYKQIYLIHFR